jgi:hypothetical protein
MKARRPAVLRHELGVLALPCRTIRRRALRPGTGGSGSARLQQAACAPLAGSRQLLNQSPSGDTAASFGRTLASQRGGWLAREASRETGRCCLRLSKRIAEHR